MAIAIDLLAGAQPHQSHSISEGFAIAKEI